MKKLLLFLILFTLLSCKENVCDIKNTTTTKMELRQLINKEETNKNSNGSYFFIIANYSSSETKQDIIKMFVKVDNTYYKMLKLDLEKVNIVINNNISKPYLQVISNVLSYHKLKDSEIISYIGYSETVYLYCPEKYLPEKLLNIELK